MKRISIIPPDQIRKHQANKSTSKVAFTFSKSKRFLSPSIQCQKAFYSSESQLSHRSASLGYGKKSDFTQNFTKTPGANSYSQKSLFDNNKKKQKGATFGIARQNSPDRSYLTPQLQKNPGPGQYCYDESSLSKIKYTIRPKTEDLIEVKLTFKETPGPGYYKQMNLFPKNGRQNVSKFSDTKFSKINPNLPRFSKQKQTPGPSNYLNQNDGLKGDSKYVLSKHKGNGTRAFSLDRRKVFTEDAQKSLKHIPGVGRYDIPSDFGVYGDAKYYKNT